MLPKTVFRLFSVVFFASGFSGLIYQMVWQRAFTLYYSVENIAITLVVAAYLLGLGLGAIAGARIIKSTQHKVSIYIIIELLIGLFGIISLPLLAYLGENTSAQSGHFSHFLYMFLFLCIPTILMGSTLPVMVKLLKNTLDDMLYKVSYLYFINTLGAAIGAIVSTYVFITFFGLIATIYVAVCINFLIALLVFVIRKQIKQATETSNATTHNLPVSDSSSGLAILFSLFVTGFLAIGLEIVWFRICGVIHKSSAYSSAYVLFIYLLGIALGSWFMNRFGNRFRLQNSSTFYLLQFANGAYVLLSVLIYYLILSRSSTIQTINAHYFEESFGIIGAPDLHNFAGFLTWMYTLCDGFFWPVFLIFIPACIMGASFPLASTLLPSSGSVLGVGYAYFFNVLGNVAGGLVTGLFLLETLGTEYSLLLFSLIALMFIIPVQLKIYFKAIAIFGLLILTAVFYPRRNLLYKSIHPVTVFDRNEKIVVSEGEDGVVASYGHGKYLRTYINGMAHGGRPSPFFEYECVQALSYNKRIKKVLVIGFGTGTTVETLLKCVPEADIKVVELNDVLSQNLEHYSFTQSILSASGLQWIRADGRRYLYSDTTVYDAIFMDPIRFYSSLSNNIYSKEFFEIAQKKLAVNGIFMMWSDEQHIQPKTLCMVFPYVKKYESFSVASNQKLNQLNEYKNSLLALLPESRNEIELIDKADVPVSREEFLKNNVKYPVNEDYFPRCEYYLGLNLYE